VQGTFVTTDTVGADVSMQGSNYSKSYLGRILGTNGFDGNGFGGGGGACVSGSAGAGRPGYCIVYY
jgi:hypothetical protein